MAIKETPSTAGIREAFALANLVVSAHVVAKMNDGCNCTECISARAAWQKWNCEWKQMEVARLTPRPPAPPQLPKRIAIT